ncbi:hypothetical protein LIP_0502 [Limnochorda pilosa]|uniref:Uncharacterized protein n=1 Tax=Limnochorda pilosa TaxID=1555112 RepID=A0A0K2SHQ1_LIMPI|nr:hypothetical protein LIP_0502 [Limnochorda pilosa]
MGYAYDVFGRRVYREESHWQNRNHQRSEVTHDPYEGKPSMAGGTAIGYLQGG